MRKVNYKECDICHQMIGAPGYNHHHSVCDGTGTYKKKNAEVGPKDEKGKTQAWYDAMHSRRGHGPNQYTKARRLGLPDPVMSEKTRAKLREMNAGRNEEWYAENGRKISKTILKKVEKGEWHTSLAKNMHYDYKGNDLHGKWELAYAMYLDEVGIKWERCKHRFAYYFEEKNRFYTPDFYLIDEKKFIEIKGYETEKDRAKWNQFTFDLEVLKLKEMKALLKDHPELLKMIK